MSLLTIIILILVWCVSSYLANLIYYHVFSVESFWGDVQLKNTNLAIIAVITLFAPFAFLGFGICWIGTTLHNIQFIETPKSSLEQEIEIYEKIKRKIENHSLEAKHIK